MNTLRYRKHSGNTLLLSLIWTSILSVFLIINYEIVNMYTLLIQHKKNSQTLFKNAMFFLNTLEQSLMQHKFFPCLWSLQSTRSWQMQNWIGPRFCHVAQANYEIDYAISDLGSPPCRLENNKIGNVIQFFQIILRIRSLSHSVSTTPILLQQFFAVKTKELFGFGKEANEKSVLNTADAPIPLCGEQLHMIHLGPKSGVQLIES